MRGVRGFVTFLVSCLAATGLVAVPDARAVPAGFVYREGTKLMLNGQQYKFAGLNADTWFGCWPGEKAASTDANLDRYFRELNPRSMTRVWLYPNATDLDLMRRIEAAAARHGQYLMVTLTDGNDGGTQCGGLPLNYGDPGPMINHVRTVVPPFASSSTIAVWEVCNECSINPGQTKAWYRAITDEIKRLAPNTLVAIGGSTCYTTSISLEDCVNTNNLPNNDLVSIHEYDDNGGAVSHWADETAEIARRLNKPAFVGEDGLSGSGGNCGAYECNAERMIQEINSYLAEPEYAGIFWWDFKWGHATVVTVNLDTPYWTRISAYRHPWNSGTSPPPPPTGGLLSQGKPATASSLERSDLPASAAFDGNTTTRWSSQFSDPQWIRVDLGAVHAINRVVLNWEAAYGRAYRVETSTDGVAWNPVHSTTSGDGGVDDLTVNSSGRYVQMHGTVRGTQWGYSLWEFQVYGGSGEPPPPPPALVTVNDNTTGTGPGQFEYSAGWQYASDSAAKYQGDDHYSSTVGATATFRFDGAKVTWFGARASHHGIAAVSVDGGAETLVDQYAAARSDQVSLFTSQVLASGSHTLRIRVTGTRNAASSGRVISVDKMEVTTTTSPPPPDRAGQPPLRPISP